MPDASDLAEASVASPPVLPALPMPTGAPADVRPPQPVFRLPTLPTLGRGDAAGQTSGETMTEAPSDPVTAAVGSDNPHAMAAAAHFAAMRKAATMPSVKPVRGKKKRRSRRPFVVKVLVLGLLGGAGYLGRDTAFAARLKGDGYDSSIMPMTVYERPNPGTVDGTLILEGVTSNNGEAWVDEFFVDFVVSPTTGDERRQLRISRRSVEVGKPLGSLADVMSRESLSIGDSSYREPDNEGDAWVQSPRSHGGLMSGLSTVWMYQDVIDHSLRRVTPVSVVDETIGGVEVTTYEWVIPIGDYKRSAPFVAARLQLPELATSDSPVTLTISVDSDGIVRVLEVALELDAAIDFVHERVDSIHFYRMRIELDSLDDAAPIITEPTNVRPAATVEEGG